eukprot:5128792-Alexandrium_andersonii.AAC.1
MPLRLWFHGRPRAQTPAIESPSGDRRGCVSLLFAAGCSAVACFRQFSAVCGSLRHLAAVMAFSARR